MRDFFTSALPTFRKHLHFHPLPIWQTLRAYRVKTFRKDLKAALTVSALTIPQSMAYALIAGLPPEYGLYAAIVGGFFAAIFGNSNQLVCEPTNGTAIILASAFLQFHGTIHPLSAVLVVSFLVGIFQLVAGISRLGNLTQYVSRSVIVGYTTGAAILIGSNQVHNLLGFGVHATSFYDVWTTTLFSLNRTNIMCLVIGAIGIAILWFMRRWKPAFPTVLIYILLSALMVYAFDLDSKFKLEVLGAIPPSLPPFNPPPMDFQTLWLMASVALAISLFSGLEANAISKTIAASSGQMINTNQELIGLGAGNLAASFFGGMPVSGSLTRSTLNYEVGARTRMSSVYGCLFVAVMIYFAGPLTRYVPTVSLAAHLIVVSVLVISPRLIQIAVRSTRSDAIVFFSTFFATLFLPLDTAVYLGVGLSLALFLHKASAPHLIEYSFTDEGSLREIDSPQKRAHAQISIIHVEGELFFGAADLFQTQIRHICQDDIKVIILRMKNARHLDATTVMAMDQLMDFLQKDGRYMIISGITPDVSRVLKRSGLFDKIGAENIFPAEANLNVSTRNALKRALNLINAATADIRIFYDRSKAASSATHEKPPDLYEI